METEFFIQPFELKCLTGDSVHWSDGATLVESDAWVPEARKYIASGGWGEMIFQQVGRTNFSIWLSDYKIGKGRSFSALANVPLLEFTLQWDNDIMYQAKPFIHQTVRRNQFNIFYLPYMESATAFETNQHVTTLDIHCTNDFLLSMANNFPDIIFPFLEKVECQRSTSIFNKPLYATNHMLSVAENLLRLLRQPVISDYFLELGVEELLAYGLSCKYELDIKKKKTSLEDTSRIYAIRNFLLADYSEKPDLNQLARQFHMSLPKLKTAFRKVMDIAPYNFWMIHRLREARRLISDTTTSITDIAYDLGFSSLSAFSKAFKNHYSISPGDLRDELQYSKKQNIRIDNTDEQ